MWLELIIVFMLGWFVGAKVTNIWNQVTFREILKDLGVTETQMKELAQKNGIPVDDDSAKQELPVIEVKIEKHGDQLFAFRKDNDQFLGQGTDRDALIDRLTQNLNNVRVIIDKEDGADLLKS